LTASAISLCSAAIAALAPHALLDPGLDGRVVVVKRFDSKKRGATDGKAQRFEERIGIHADGCVEDFIRQVFSDAHCRPRRVWCSMKP
jgi:hypothetical protein